MYIILYLSLFLTTSCLDRDTKITTTSPFQDITLSEFIPSNLPSLDQPIDTNTIWSNILIPYTNNKTNTTKTNNYVQYAKSLYQQTNAITSLKSILDSFGISEQRKAFQTLYLYNISKQDINELKKIKSIFSHLNRYDINIPESLPLSMYQKLDEMNFNAFNTKEVITNIFLQKIKNKNYTELKEWLIFLSKVDSDKLHYTFNYYWNDIESPNDYSKKLIYYSLFDDNILKLYRAIFSMEDSLEEWYNKDFEIALDDKNIYRIFQHIEKNSNNIRLLTAQYLYHHKKFSTNTNVLNYLDYLGFDTNSIDVYALFNAVDDNNRFEVNKLIESGIDVNSTNTNGNTILFPYARTESYNFETFNLIKEISNINPNHTNNEGHTALSDILVGYTYNPKIIENYIRYLPLPDSAPYYQFDQYKREDTCIYGHDSPPQSGDYDLVTDTNHPYGGLISYAIQGDYDTLMDQILDKEILNIKSLEAQHYLTQAVKSNKVKIIHILLKYGIDYSAHKTYIDRSEHIIHLYNAVLQNDISKAKIILQKSGLDINVRKVNGNTLLHCVLYVAKTNRNLNLSSVISTIQFLKEQGLDFHATNYITEFRKIGFHAQYNIFSGSRTALLEEYIKHDFVLPKKVMQYQTWHTYQSNRIYKPIDNYDDSLSYAADQEASNVIRLLYEKNYVKLDSPSTTNVFIYSLAHYRYAFLDYMFENNRFLDYFNGTNNIVQMAENVDISYIECDEETTFAIGGPFIPDNLRTLVFKKYKDKFLKIYPQFHHILDYKPIYNFNLPNSIASIQAQETNISNIFDPIDFNVNQRVLFKQNISKTTDIGLLINTNLWRRNDRELKKRELELFKFLLKHGADPNYITDTSSQQSLLMKSSFMLNGDVTKILMNLPTIDLAHTNVKGDNIFLTSAKHRFWFFEDQIINLIEQTPTDQLHLMNATNNQGETFYSILKKDNDNFDQYISKILKKFPLLNTNIPSVADLFLPFSISHIF